MTLFLVIVSFSLLLILGALVIFAAHKEDIFQQLRNDHEKLLASFNDLDEQAKLIIRTDMELNRTQEELDKRLSGLHALQQTSRQISHCLNANEVFQKVQGGIFKELGFQFAIIALRSPEKIYHEQLSVGFRDAAKVIGGFQRSEILCAAMDKAVTLSSLSAPLSAKQEVLPLFETEHFVLTPIINQAGTIGFIFVGNRHTAPPVTSGDEEVMGIFASQLGQACENAELFEQVYRSSQELELKVKERTHELRQALVKVEEISKKKTEFISAVSHELRTPLTSIKGYASLLTSGKIGEMPDAVKERIGKINTHSDNLVSLINNLLDIARIESGRVELKFEDVLVSQMVDGIVDLLTPQLKDKDLRIQKDFNPLLVKVHVDLSQVDRVFINLLSNAIKFTPKGGTITLSGQAPDVDGYAHFMVMDTGIGIGEDDISRLFSEFFRVENEINQSLKGTGLGLVLVKNIVEAHHRKIWVESKIGIGTTFHFQLPVSKESLQRRIMTQA